MGEHDHKKNWKELFADWLFQQGVSTVLLLINVSVTVYALYYFAEKVIPRHDEAVERMIMRVESQHASTTKYVADSFREALREARRD